MELAFSAAVDEVPDAGESEAADLFILQAEGFLLAGDLFQGTVELVDGGAVLVAIGVGEQVLAAMSFEADMPVAEGLADASQAFIAHLHELKHLVFSHLPGIGDQLCQATEAGESRIAGAGAGRDEATLDDGNTEEGGQAFEVISAPEPYQAATGDNNIGWCK